MRVERIGSATLYLANCLDVLPDIPAFAAIVTDPPYGIGFAAQPTKWQRRAGKTPEAWDDEVVSNLPYILSKGVIQAVWGGNYYGLPPSRGWLSWFKPDAPPSMASIELCWTNLNQNARQISHSISATNAERCGHPTQKPLSVMIWTLQQVGCPSGVLDPFMGSGTTGVACARLGSKFTGMEINEAYFDIACRRIEEAQRQRDMFVQAPIPQDPADQRLADLFAEPEFGA